MCQPKECVQQLQATNFVSHELKTDFIIGCIQRWSIGDVADFINQKYNYLQMKNSEQKDECLTSSGNIANAMLPAVAVLKIRNFKAKLPDDFVQLVSIETIPKEKMARTITGTLDDYVVTGHKTIAYHDTFMFIPTETEMMYRNMAMQIKNRAFCLKENDVLFVGSYSNFLLKRWMQKLIELFFPEKVIVKYVNAEMHGSHSR